MIGRRDRAGDRVLREVGRWLDGDGAGADLSLVSRWDAAMWRLAGDVAFTQGVAAHLHGSVAGSPLEARMPAALRARLAEQHARTDARSRRIHGDLERILGAAQGAGVAVMPLKGGLLTTLGLVDPTTRPMADLDLLIHDEDRSPMLAALRSLGLEPTPGGRQAGRDELRDPNRSTVISWTSEDPDNPCPVELLRRVDKRPWAHRVAYDLTDLLWAEARPVEILGRPAMRPSDRVLLIHLAAHAAMNLVAGTGRLVQLIDLAAVAPLVPHLGATPVPRLVHTALTITHRLLPTAGAGALAADLEPDVPWGLRRWSRTVPLDTRSGLADGTPLHEQSSRRRYWARWRPAPWRLWAGNADASLPRAYVLHARAMRQHHRYWKMYRRRHQARGDA